jgi:hypothetical protein
MAFFDRAGACVVSAVLLLGASAAEATSAAAALNSSPTLGSFVLYAERSIKVGAFDHVSGGDVGVAATAVSSFGDQVIVGDHAQVDAAQNILSPSVTLGAKSQVGDVEVDVLHNDGATSVGAVANYPAALMPAPPVAGSPTSSTTSVTVGSGRTITLTPGAYGALSIADHANVTLAAGTYSFTSVTISDHVQVTGDAAGVTILIGGSLSLASWDQVAPAGGAPAGQLVLLVGGRDEPTGPAAAIGLHTQVAGLVAAPHGTLALADHVQATGAFAGFDVTLANHSLVSFQTGFSPSSTPAQHGLQQLSGYITAQIAAAPLVGPLPGTQPIDFAIGLPMGDPSGLQTFIEQVSDPTSPQYRQYVKSPSDFAARFGPTSSDYQLLQLFVQSVGLTVVDTFTNNLLVHVYGPAAVIERAFYTNFSLRMRPDGTQFYSVDVEPSLDFATPILRISGFDNYDVGVPGVGGSGTGGLFQGTDFRNAYLGTPAPSPLMGLTGAGVNGGTPQHIALFELDPLNVNDVSAYLGLIGGGTVNLNLISYSPGSGTQTCQSKEPGGQTEVAGDVEIATSIAPGAVIDVYSMPNPCVGGNISTLLNLIADCPDQPPFFGGHGCGFPLANQISMSWLATTDDNTFQVIQEFAAQGQSFFVASGDNGAYVTGSPCLGQICPTGALDIRFTASPLATIVGGTIMTMTGGGATYGTETTWNDGNGAGGGGILNFLEIPTFPPGPAFNVNQPLPTWQPCQQNAASGCSTQYRNLPDVSAVAESDVGCSGSSLGKLGCGSIVGTSFSTPLWAGFTALINEQAAINGAPPVGFLNPALYQIAQTVQYQSAFNDIQDGSNNNGFTAVQGYDLATGLGSPRWPLIYALVGGATPPPPPPGGPMATVGASSGFFGEDVCITAPRLSGWLAGYQIRTLFEGIPGQNGPVSGNGVATVQQDGSFQLKDTDVGQKFMCNPTQLQTDIVTVVISEISPVTDQVVDGTQLSVPAFLFCVQHPAVDYGAGCH